MRSLRKGLFAFGLGYDQSKSTLVVARFSDGKTEPRDIVPVVRHYDIQKINGLPEKYVSPPAEVLAGNGSDDCLTILYRTFLDPNDTVAFPWPSYGLYQTLAPWAEAALRVTVGLALVPHGLRNTFGMFPKTGVRSHNLASSKPSSPSS